MVTAMNLQHTSLESFIRLAPGFESTMILFSFPKETGAEMLLDCCFFLLSFVTLWCCCSQLV